MTPEAELVYAKWDKERDPILADQVRVLESMLQEDLDAPELEGFLIVCARLVDDIGKHRTADLGRVFLLDRPEGRRALKASLRHVRNWVGGMATYETEYPVTINPSFPAYPQLKLVGIETLYPHLYRVFDRRARTRGTDELVRDVIVRTGKLTPVPIQAAPVLRSKPHYHWCSNQRWETPELTRQALQILPEWGSDCGLRARLPTAQLGASAFVAFNGDLEDPSDPTLSFYGYFYEPTAVDHDVLPGGGVQIGVDGDPVVDALEEWDESSSSWHLVWAAE